MNKPNEVSLEQRKLEVIQSSLKKRLAGTFVRAEVWYTDLAYESIAKEILTALNGLDKQNIVVGRPGIKWSKSMGSGRIEL